VGKGVTDAAARQLIGLRATIRYFRERSRSKRAELLRTLALRVSRERSPRGLVREALEIAGWRRPWSCPWTRSGERICTVSTLRRLRSWTAGAAAR